MVQYYTEWSSVCVIHVITIMVQTVESHLMKQCIIDISKEMPRDLSPSCYSLLYTNLFLFFINLLYFLFLPSQGLFVAFFERERLHLCHPLAQFRLEGNAYMWNWVSTHNRSIFLLKINIDITETCRSVCLQYQNEN